MKLSFFRVIFSFLSALNIATSLQLNSSAISYKYASGYCSIYLTNFSGQIFFGFLTLIFTSPNLPSFSLFIHLISVVSDILNTLQVSLKVCPSSLYSITRCLNFIS